MITFLEGKLVEALPTQVTVAVHGIGYEVLIPLSSYDKLPPLGGAVKLLTHLAVREVIKEDGRTPPDGTDNGPSTGTPPAEPKPSDSPK